MERNILWCIYSNPNSFLNVGLILYFHIALGSDKAHYIAAMKIEWELPSFKLVEEATAKWFHLVYIIITGRTATLTPPPLGNSVKIKTATSENLGALKTEPR